MKDQLKVHFPKFEDVNNALKTYDINRQKATPSTTVPSTIFRPIVMATVTPA